MIDPKDDGRARRPGGRSARVRAAVLRATVDELKEGGVAGLSISAVARRSGVHPTSIYRRWKTPERLALDAALAESRANVPIPDTGSLGGDLAEFLTGLDTYVRSTLGRALLALSAVDEPNVNAARSDFWRERLGAAKVMFDRAVRRGEIDPGADAAAALEAVIAPIYLRALVMQLDRDGAAITRHLAMILRGLGHRSERP